MQNGSYSMAGFLAMAFAVVGLTGLMAAHLAPLPLQRALAREAVLDEALAAARGPGSGAALEALRMRLGDSAAAVLASSPELETRIAAERLETRIAAERLAMRARRVAEAEATGLRLRVMLAVVTVLAGGFAVVLVLAGRRSATRQGTA